LARRPWLYWLVVAVVALAAASVTSGMVHDATAPVRRFGRLVRVPVAARSVPMGTTLASDDVTWRSLPSRVLPSEEMEAAPVGRTVFMPVVAGEPLLASKFAPPGVSGVAALLPAGARALSVPAAAGNPSMQRGDRVDVLATVEGGEEPTFAVTTDAVVLDVTPDVVTVAVVADDAPRVAWALSRGVVTLSLASPYE
jgi:Flp pilus assembly protein CpaB